MMEMKKRELRETMPRVFVMRCMRRGKGNNIDNQCGLSITRTGISPQIALRERVCGANHFFIEASLRLGPIENFLDGEGRLFRWW